MGFTVLDEITLDVFPQPVSNAYVAFGTTNALITAYFDETQTRVYKCNIEYGIWQNKVAFDYGLQPITRVPVEILGTVESVSNIHTFLYSALFDNFSSNVDDDGIDN